MNRLITAVGLVFWTIWAIVGMAAVVGVAVKDVSHNMDVRERCSHDGSTMSGFDTRYRWVCPDGSEHWLTGRP